MQNGGFYQRRGTSPVALGVIIAGHAALLAAIALNPIRFGPHIDYIPQLQDYRDDVPPPPDEPPPPPKQQRSQTPPEKVDRIVDTLPRSDEAIHLQPLPVDPGPLPVPRIEPAPLLREATIDPAAASRFQPDYPPSMVRAGIEGTATVRVLIGGDGRVRTVELVTATDPAFFEATKAQALRHWRFRPATRDGAAIESWRTMTVKFRLES